MTVMVGLNIVIAAILAITAALSIGASIGMRGNRPIALFGLALFLGSVQTTIMGNAGAGAELVAAALLAPTAYYVVALGISRMTPQSRPSLAVGALALVLSLLASLLALAGTAYFAPLMAVQSACAIATVYATLEMMRRAKPGNLLDSAIVGGLWLISACSLARIPLLLLYYGFDVSAGEFRSSGIEIVLMTISGLTAPLIIFLLIARNVADTLTTYQRQSERDALTGLLNRRGIDTLAALPGKTGGAVIFCDIDHFKSVNDLFGHQAGDAVIRSFAQSLAGPGYPAGRMGGEEFAVLLEGHSLSEAADLAEMFRARCAGADHPGLPPGTSVTASFGVAAFASGATPHSAFAAADRALYKAKRDGRDRVVTDPSMAQPDILDARQVA